MVHFYDQDDVQRFVGHIFPTRAGRTMSYECVAGNYWLDGTPVRQQCKFLEGASFTLRDITKVRLGGADRVLADDVQAVVDACAAQWSVPMTLNTTDIPDHKNPEEIRRDMKGTELVRSVCEWAPYLDYRYNYDSGVELDFFSVLPSAVSITGGSLPANRHTRRSVPVTEIERSPEPRFDPMHRALIKTLRIYWASVTPHILAEEGKPVLAWKRDVDVATASPSNGSEAIMELTMDLRRPSFDGTEDADDAELKVDNLAARLLAPYARLWKAMSWQTRKNGRHCAFDIVPGELWDCEGADPAYEDAGSVCQVVTHNLKRGTTTVQCGAPKQLGFYNPRLTNRLRRAATEDFSGGQNFGFEKKTALDEGGTEYNIYVAKRTGPTSDPEMYYTSLKCTLTPLASGEGLRLLANYESGGTSGAGKLILIGAPE